MVEDIVFSKQGDTSTQSTPLPHNTNIGAEQSQPPSNKSKDFDICVLSIIFLVIGVIAITGGIINGLLSLGSYRTEDFAPFYFVGGILIGMFYFALAVIVDACQKYRKNHKN